MDDLVGQEMKPVAGALSDQRPAQASMAVGGLLDHDVFLQPKTADR
jgi:hypothetical protein